MFNKLVIENNYPFYKYSNINFSHVYKCHDNNVSGTILDVWHPLVKIIN